MLSLRILGIWLHLSAIVVWIGVTIGWILVLVTDTPSVPTGPEERSIARLGRRVYTIGWEALFVVVLTGLFNLLPRVDSGRLFEPSYFFLLLVKVSFVVGMVGIQFWQHLWLVPNLRGEGGKRRFRRSRRDVLIGSAVFILLAAGALWCGVRLRFG